MIITKAATHITASPPNDTAARFTQDDADGGTHIGCKAASILAINNVAMVCDNMSWAVFAWHAHCTPP
jgi:hypothetical protein